VGTAQLNMANGIREFGRATPSRVAVVDGDRSQTFAALDERSNRLASALLGRGLQPGQPVALLSGNRLEYFEIATAMAKAGLPLVPLNSRNSSTDNEFIIGHSGARALLLDPCLSGNAETFVSGMDHVLSLDGGAAGEDYESVLADAPARDPRVQVPEDEAFCISYTSGTTGRPKGVVLTHRSRVLTNYAAAVEYGLGPSRRTTAVAPMYHGAGFAFAFAGVQLGGTVWVLRQWDPEVFLRMLQESRSSTVFLVPTHAQQIRRIVEEPSVDYDLSALQTLYFNAAALPVALKEWVHQAFPQVGVHELYGSTECAVVTDLRPEDSLRKAGSVGHPWLMNEVRLLEDGVEVPVGTPGELFARSPLLMKGYLHDEAATRAATTEDGFVTVGDIAVQDDEGFLSIVDRKTDMINVGGVNVYPREIEEVAAQHREVGEVAVLGVPDEVYGERIIAFVVARKGGGSVDARSVDAHVQARVAKYKVPREWHVLDELPRNSGGKVLKRDIRARYLQDERARE